MKKMFVSCAMVAALAASLAAQPSIASGGILNNASYLPSVLPNGSVAQGSIFVIFGANLGPAAVVTQPSYPLQTTLGGTSVKVTVAGTTVDAIPIYTLAGQVGVVLPSRTPVGTGTVTVTYNGQTSATAPITVVANSVGVFALNQAGSGPGIITDVNYNVFGPTNAARAGDVIIIWATGLGAITESETAAPSPRDLTGIPARVVIGGKTANIAYRGRSGCCAGLDQIVATVPSGAEGCFASVVIAINNVVSNITTLPIATSGRTCTDTNGVSSTDIQPLLNNPNFSIGTVSLSRNTSQTPAIGPLPASTSTLDGGSAVFTRYTPAIYNASLGLFQQASFGSCIVTTIVSGRSSSTAPQGTTLDAGAVINVNGPNGAKTLTKSTAGGVTVYSATLGGGSGPTALPLYIPANGGSFRFDNGAGGADVKGFNVTLGVPTPLVWTNMDAIPVTIPRTSGLTVNWSGGDPNSYVNITGTSVLTSPITLSSYFSCTVPVSAATFTVPVEVLLSLPPTQSISAGGITIPVGSLSVSNYGNPVKFTAPGLDLGYASWSVGSSKTVNYQ